MTILQTPSSTIASLPSFESLGVAEPLLRALRGADYHTPTSIQLQAIPPALAGRDVLGCAQTGTGKTAAFALPILQHLSSRPAPVHGTRPVRALILSPTRELASQIAASFERYGVHTGLRTTVVYGGVGIGPQAATLRRGIDVLVATPGRLADFLKQGLLSLEHVEVFVLDEADRMLDDGFLHEVRRIASRLPRKRQTLFFSATMPQAIRPLADQLLTDPVRVEATPVASTPDTVTQCVYFVDSKNKRALLSHLLDDGSITRAIVFTRTKRGADRTALHLTDANIGTEAIHGDKTQGARERALSRFREGRARILVATDLAARGIDIASISHVINFDLPEDPEAYVHRIGRTARAGASGRAISLCSHEERDRLASIEKLIRRRVPTVEHHPFAPTGAASVVSSAPARSAWRGPSRGNVRRSSWKT